MLEFNKERHGFCCDFLIVEKTLEIMVEMKGAEEGDRELIRIEALHEVETGKYIVRVYREMLVLVDPEYHGDEPQSYRAWVSFDEHDMASACKRSANDAIEEALRILRMDCKEPDYGELS